MGSELVERAKAMLAETRDCTVCDGDGIKESGKDCGGCDATGKVLRRSGPDAAFIREAAATLSAQEEQIARLTKALTECAADWRSPPTTLGYALDHVSAEFTRRMQVAMDALEGSKRDG